MSIGFDEIEFLHETENLFCEMVEASTSVANPSGRTFLLSKHLGGNSLFLPGPPWRDWKDVDEAALNDLVGKGTTRRAREVVAPLFGEESRQWQRLFSTEEGESLADLRSHLAHGAKSELSPSEARIVRDRVSEVRRICREFLARLLLRLRPDDPLPDFMARLGIGISFRDPRNLQVVSSVEQLSEDDWSIKPDWISWR